MSTKTHFKDSNFKLAVIQVLMYEKGLLLPKFNLREFVSSNKTRSIDIDAEGYEPIPEARQYFEELEVPSDLLAEVDKLFQDGGNDIYMEICPFWSGEDDVFNIRSAEDAALLPKLKSVTLFFDNTGDRILNDFRMRAVTAQWL
jgi:hypothetical protein